MPREFSRTQRLASQMQRSISEIIASEVGDPRIGMVTVTGVEVSRDLAHAKVYVDSVVAEDDMSETLPALQQASAFIRHQLNSRLHVRMLPQLHFHSDRSNVEGARLSRLIDDAIAQDEERHQPAADTDDE